MKIGYRMAVEDYVAFHVYHVRSSPACWRGRMRWGVTVAVGCMVLFPATGIGGGGWYSVLCGAIVGGLFIVWAFAGNDGNMRRSVATMYKEGENRGVGGLESLEATDAGLVSAEELCECRFDWRMVERVVNTPDYYFIYIGAIKAHVVPKLKIEEGDFETFRAEVEARFRVVRADAEQRIVNVERPVVAGAMGPKSGVLGYVSIGGGLVAGALYGAMMGCMMMGANTAEALEQAYQLGKGFLLGAVSANLFGLIVGIVGLAKRSQKKGPAIVGVAVNAALVLGIVGLVVLGRVIRAMG